MKKILLIVLSLISFHAFTQQDNIEIAPNANNNPSASRDSLNLYFSFPTIAFIGEYGVESDGSIIYVTQWLDDTIAKYDQSGNVLDEFVIDGVERTRDMAWDGQYYYGSPNDFFFYVLDLDNQALIDTFQTIFRVRGMAYDWVENVLWATEMWDPMFYKMDMQGDILDSWLASGVTMGSLAGLAYDNQSPGGPFLWGFSQDSTGAMIVKYNIATKSQTGNIIDVSGLVTDAAYAGGLYLEDAPLDDTPVIGGMIQNLLVFALELDYANMLVGLGGTKEVVSLLKIYPNPAGDILNVDITTEMRGIYSFRIFNQSGQIVERQEEFLNESSTISINTENLKSGVYFLQVSCDQGLDATSKFVIE